MFQSQVDEVKAKIDIVSLIGERVDLKKAGRNFKALCPFHSEKTPSFMVSPELQMFKCFGCDLGGDVFTFLQQYEGMDFYETLKLLADRAGVELSPRKPGFVSRKEKLYQVNTLVSFFYNYILHKHQAGKKALKYLMNTRGLKPETVKKFQLGYSPDKPFALRSFLVEKKKIKISDLEEAGVVFTRNGRPLDRFRGRVIFPLFDHRGNIAGFAGRTFLQGRQARYAKYINTPETAVYHKSALLYGFNITKGAIKRKNKAVIVEGEFDMISSWQAGIRNVVAIKGSALTQDQVKLLSRCTNRLVLALDSDAAGDAASRKGIEIAEKEGFDIKVATFGKHKDPDEMAKSDPDGLKRSIKDAEGIWDYTIDSIFSQNTTKKGQNKAQISRQVVPVLALIDDRIVQAHYIAKVARKLGIPVEAVTSQVSRVNDQAKMRSPKVATTPIKGERSRREILEERLLAIAFSSNPLVLVKKRVHSLVRTSLTERILDNLRAFVKKDGRFDPSEFAGYLPNELVDGFANMILAETKGNNGSPRKYKEEINLLLKELQIIDVKDKLQTVTKKIVDFEDKKDKVKLQKAKEKFEKLTRLLVKFEEENLK
jgi:DNA primase